MGYGYQHPEITRCLRTGYPREQEEHFCRLCGSAAKVYREDKGFMCFDCARYAFEDLSDEEAVELLGFEVIDEF